MMGLMYGSGTIRTHLDLRLGLRLEFGVSPGFTQARVVECPDLSWWLRRSPIPQPGINHLPAPLWASDNWTWVYNVSVGCRVYTVPIWP